MVNTVTVSANTSHQNMSGDMDTSARNCRGYLKKNIKILTPLRISEESEAAEIERSCISSEFIRYAHLNDN